MAFKAPSIGSKDLSTAVAAALKALPKELAAGPKVVIRPEIIGIILRERLELKEALDTAAVLAKGIGTAARGNEALKGLKISEPGLLVTKKGILAGFFPTDGPTFEF
ncbi:MAG TPA: hypothetical protein VFQ91_05620 [Bryobacteraceae bacterium]|nr:hypothetical protein [Bryobacteraceae bacterium]